MKTRDFHYDLPPELIAQSPLEQRSSSRLLCMEREQAGITHHAFSELPELLQAGDLLVFNDTRVIPARLYGTKSSGGRVEILIERLLDARRALAHVRASKSPKTGARIHIEGTSYTLSMTARHEDLFELESDSGIEFAHLMQQAGHVPLPHYIAREDEAQDIERYQTVYARQPGAVAAPTAGLHFDQALLDRLRNKGIAFAYVTLHVGAGTFQPVRTENISDHRMHAEYIEVSEETVARCQQTRAQGHRIVAVGTTSVRCLESASRHGKLEAYCGDTEIFIYPGYRFQSVDAMITNFHLPESTLLMLVSAFAGREFIMAGLPAGDRAALSFLQLW